MEWLEYITNKLVSSNNPTGTISNSNLELAEGGGVTTFGGPGTVLQHSGAHHPKQN